MKLFSGESNPALAEKVAKLLGKNISKSEVVRFSNSEVRVRVEDDVKGETTVVIQPTSNPTDASTMELFFFADALKRSEAAKMIAVIPYFGYARQNIQHRPGEDVSANVIVKFIETVGFDEVIVFDLHDEATGGMFTIPFKNLSAYPVMAEEIKKAINPSSAVVVSPDQGGVERARNFANHFQNENALTAMIEKKRDLDNIHKSHAVELFGDVKGKTAILVDDIVTSGGTLLHAADLCLEHEAKEVVAVISHHDFSDKAPKLIQDSKLSKFYTTDTIALRADQKFPKLHEISVAPTIAEALKAY